MGEGEERNENLLDEPFKVVVTDVNSSASVGRLVAGGVCGHTFSESRSPAFAMNLP